MNCTYAKHKLIIISHLHPKYLFYLPRKPNYKNKKLLLNHLSSLKALKFYKPQQSSALPFKNVFTVQIEALC